jgi:hypothetical protein
VSTVWFPETLTEQLDMALALAPDELICMSEAQIRKTLHAFDVLRDFCWSEWMSQQGCNADGHGLDEAECVSPLNLSEL